MTRRLLIILVCAAIAAPVSAQTPPTPDPTGPEVEPPTPERPRRRRPRQGTEPRPVDRPAPAAPAAPAPAPATAAPPAGAPVVPAAPPAATPAATNPPATTTPPTAPGAVPTGDLPGEDSELYRCKRFKPTDKIKVTLKPDTDLKDLVAWVMGFTCKSFIFGNAISSRASKVTIIAPAEMTPQEAYRLFLVGLQTMNLTIVPKGRTLELVETQRGREMPLPVYRSGKAVPGQDQVVRAIIRPEHVTAEELVTVLNAVKTGTGTVTPLGTAGAVLVTDYGSSIDKMMDILKEVDAPTGGEKIYIIYLQNADAQDIAQKLGDIFGTGRAGAAGAPAAPAPQIPAAAQPNQPRPATAAPATRGGTGGSAAPSKIIADTRTNSLIVIASERAYQRIVALVRRLDVGGTSETGSINVYYLKNADAEQLAGTMNTLITGVAPQRPAQPGQPGQPQQTRPANVPAAVAQPGGAAGSLAGAFEGTIKLTHDKPTNSLVVVSSPRDFFALREVIKKLDLPRGQVFVEATILEVSLDKARKIGFAYHGGKQFSTSDGDVTVIGGVESATLQSLDPLGSAVNLDGLIGGVIGPLIPGLSIPSIGVLFQIAQNNTEVNVLSAPNILTTDNEAAEIKVGQNIPYQAATFAGLPGLTQQQGQQGGITGFGGLGANIQRQDVDLSLKITPHVSDEHVRLEVELDIKDIQGEIPGLGPTWSTRRVKTPIVVRDQQPVVIGGLMSERETVAETKVPVLGDIPLLGYLFKYSRRQRVKTNLLIFLTPYVIKDQSDVQRIFAQKVRERREFIEAYSSLAARDIEPYVDYRRKRGLVEEINKAVFTSDEDERLLREATQNKGKFMGEEGPVEMPPELRDAPPPDSTTPPPPQPSPPPGDE